MNLIAGIVLLNETGEYAREYEVKTHGGDQVKTEWVQDINKATVFINKAYAARRNKELQGKAALHVEVVRTVRITGDGT